MLTHLMQDLVTLAPRLAEEAQVHLQVLHSWAVLFDRVYKVSLVYEWLQCVMVVMVIAGMSVDRPLTTLRISSFFDCGALCT